MLPFEISFDSPWYLLMLVLLPVLWIFSYRSLAGLGNVRRLLAISLRSLVVLLVIFSLAEIQLRKSSDRMTVIFLLDQSESIPMAQRQAMLQYVSEAVHQHRRAERSDRAGVIVFAREATIEVPPFDSDIFLPSVESYTGRTDATNLEAAIKLAQAAFPEDTAKRLVVVTDGNENVGSVRSVMPLLAEQGIGLDVVPVWLHSRSEVEVEKLTLPSNIRRGQTVEARVIVNRYDDVNRPPQDTVPGRLRLIRTSGPAEQLLAEEHVQLEPGTNVFPFRHRIEEPAFYTYMAEFVPDNPEDDFLPQNNRATAYAHVRGRGRLLLIEDAENVGQFDFLAQRLREEEIEVVMQSTAELFRNLADLQGYDGVMLANVPRSSGQATFSDQQIEALVRNTEQIGAGLIKLGGPASFGAGGWANTELEKAMPVDFQIKNLKVVPVSALILVIDRSGSMSGDKMTFARTAAIEAVKVLGDQDYVGVCSFDVEPTWNVPPTRASQRQRIINRIARLQAGGGTDLFPAMRDAYSKFHNIDASVKHMLVLSDGWTPEANFTGLVRQMQRDGITVSAVAVGDGADAQLMETIARHGGGQFYMVNNPRALPRVFISEARRIARPLVYEPDGGVQPQITAHHEILQGIQGPLPPVKGFVMTTVKDHPLVETAIRSPTPETPENTTILAAWTYGLGRTVSLTTDAGQRWADAWTQWEDYDKFFSQMVRWAMRPIQEGDNVTISTEVHDGQVQVVATALDQEDRFLNLLPMMGGVVGPDLQPRDLAFEQVAPGRYVGRFEASQTGSYFLTVRPGPDQPPILTGVNVPYSDEYRDRETNLPLLTTLASLQPGDGEAGKMLEGQLEEGQMAELVAVDTFRPGVPQAISIRDVWPWVLMIAGCLFFADVFVRRVMVDVIPWLQPIVRWWKRKPASEEKVETIGRLQSRKKTISQQIDQRRAANRFEPQSEWTPADNNLLETSTAEGRSPSPGAVKEPTADTQLAPETPDRPDYTARLLEAKRRASRGK